MSLFSHTWLVNLSCLVRCGFFSLSYRSVCSHIHPSECLTAYNVPLKPLSIHLDTLLNIRVCNLSRWLTLRKIQFIKTSNRTVKLGKFLFPLSNIIRLKTYFLDYVKQSSLLLCYKEASIYNIPLQALFQPDVYDEVQCAPFLRQPLWIDMLVDLCLIPLARMASFQVMAYLSVLWTLTEEFGESAWYIFVFLGY